MPAISAVSVVDPSLSEAAHVRDPESSHSGGTGFWSLSRLAKGVTVMALSKC